MTDQHTRLVRYDDVLNELLERITYVAYSLTDVDKRSPIEWIDELCLVPLQKQVVIWEAIWYAYLDSMMIRRMSRREKKVVFELLKLRSLNPELPVDQIHFQKQLDPSEAIIILNIYDAYFDGSMQSKLKSSNLFGSAAKK